jgi:hypothetical protein
MSRQPLLKVYGHIYPVDKALYAALEHACADAMPDEDDLPVIEHDGDMARISFEGIYFPLDDVLDVLTAHVRAEHKGKLDVLDLESWRLIRHIFTQGRVDVHSAPLNNVLDYSGH